MNSRAVLLFLLALLVASCSDGFGRPRGQQRLYVEIVSGDLGTSAAPRPLSVDAPIPFRVLVRALRIDGSVDTSFNRFVRLSAKPGAIEPIVSAGAEGRNVYLEAGEAREVEVRLANAFGVTYIVADDIGYEPGDPFGEVPPACSDGIDNDGDGKIDFPADEGCAFANDLNEGNATYAQGASQPIYFKLPRIAQVRGVQCPGGTCSGTGLTPYQKEQIRIDTGYRERLDGPPVFEFDTIVTRIASNGFYAQDVSYQENGFSGFNGIFAFNFNPPPRMRVCDRLKTFSGTANEFFGFTQVSYPTWTLEEWDPKRRLCGVPDPDGISPADASDEGLLLPKSGKLVRVFSTPLPAGGGPRERLVRITQKFGNGKARRTQTGFFFGPDPAPAQGEPPSPTAAYFSDCDFNGDSTIDFGPGEPPLPEATRIANCNDPNLLPIPSYCEGICANACDRDPDCSEYSNYNARGTFRLNLTDANRVASAIQADASAFAGFDPLLNRGIEIRSFTGTLHYFSGGSQFTIEARCKDDIILDMNAAPFESDKRTDLAQPPPPLACVFPRTFLDENPQ